MIEEGPPFDEAKMSDIFYKSLVKYPKRFWSKMGLNFSNELKDLLEKMLTL